MWYRVIYCDEPSDESSTVARGGGRRHHEVVDMHVALLEALAGSEVEVPSHLVYLANSGQRTSDSGQRTSDTGQRTANSGQKTADSGHRQWYNAV